LHLLGWTEEEIGDVTKLTRRAVNEIVKNTNFSKIDNEYKEGKPIEEIAKYYGLDLTTSLIEESFTHEV
jgi:hypothetical protein